MELEKLIEKFKNEQLEEPTEYTEPAENPFDAPIPGQSLTDEPGNYPWEHPPQRATVEEALDEIYESMMEEQNMKRMFTLLRMGIPVEALVKVITFSGFLEGKYTVDVAKLLEPIVAMMIAGEAKLAEIPARINMGDAGDSKFFQDISEKSTKNASASAPQFSDDSAVLRLRLRPSAVLRPSKLQKLQKTFAPNFGNSAKMPKIIVQPEDILPFLVTLDPSKTTVRSSNSLDAFLYRAPQAKLVIAAI